MSRHRTLLPLFAVAGAAVVGFVPSADRAAAAGEKPAVSLKADLPPKNFTQEIKEPEIKFDMVYVPGGEFTMGSSPGEPGREPHEGPPRRVRVSALWVGKCEVTWDEYRAFWEDEAVPGYKQLPDAVRKTQADALSRPTNTYVDFDYGHGVDGYPALCMSHHAAMMYCHWLRSKTGRAYRLPTEAEWEYACRAGHAGLYGFDEAADKLPDHAWYKHNSPDPEFPKKTEGCTHPVGKKKANAFGLHDMHGNVAEWVLDQYDPTFYARTPAGQIALNPVNKPTDKKWAHVVRGGSWADKAEQLRAASRRASNPDWMKDDPQFPRSIWWLTNMDVVGFRVALPVEEIPALADLKPSVLKKPD